MNPLYRTLAKVGLALIVVIVDVAVLVVIAMFVLPIHEEKMKAEVKVEKIF